jgi:hypothetical protein
MGAITAATITRKGFQVAQDGTSTISVGGSMIHTTVIATGTHQGETAVLVKLVINGGPAEWSIYTPGHRFGLSRRVSRTRKLGLAAIGR